MVGRNDIDGRKEFADIGWVAIVIGSPLQMGREEVLLFERDIRISAGLATRFSGFIFFREEHGRGHNSGRGIYSVLLSLGWRTTWTYNGSNPNG